MRIFPHAVFALRTEKKNYGSNESQNKFSSFEITIVVSLFLAFCTSWLLNTLWR